MVEGEYHVARVTVPDDAWAAFRRVALAQVRTPQSATSQNYRRTAGE
jgi:hypothetical protein